MKVTDFCCQVKHNKNKSCEWRLEKNGMNNRKYWVEQIDWNFHSLNSILCLKMFAEHQQKKKENGWGNFVGFLTGYYFTNWNGNNVVSQSTQIQLNKPNYGNIMTAVKGMKLNKDKLQHKKFHANGLAV